MTAGRVPLNPSDLRASGPRVNWSNGGSIAVDIDQFEIRFVLRDDVLRYIGFSDFSKNRQWDDAEVPLALLRRARAAAEQELRMRAVRLDKAS